MTERVIDTPLLTSPSTPTLSVNQGTTEMSSGDSKWLRYGLIIIVLAVLGFNIFTYLGEITQYLTDLFWPIIQKIALFFGITLSETIKVSAEGAKEGVKIAAKGVAKGTDVAAGIAVAGVDTVSTALQTGVKVAASTVKNSANVMEKAVSGDVTINNVDNKNVYVQKQNAWSSFNENKIKESQPVPDDIGSRVQSNKTIKSGYCYIGEDKGFRNCAKVTEADKCMSGDIFPTLDICVNPNLRE
jgi:hypothetical protein